MKAMATYIMRGRMSATLIASLFAVLSLILPPLSYISGAVVALVTLRKGAVEGALLALMSTVALGILSYFTVDSVFIAGFFVLLLWLPIWILASVLRSTISLSITLVLATLLTIIAVIGFHITVGNPGEWWGTLLDQVLEQAKQQPELGILTDPENLKTVALMITAIMATAFFVSMVVSLFLGRWWQALLYNPGGFQQEFHQFRIDKIFAAVAAVILIWASLGSTVGSLAMDVAVVICVYASVAGIALLHHWVKTKQANVAWLVLTYLLLMFLTPQIMLLLAIVGFMDAWLNMRRFYQDKTI